MRLRNSSRVMKTICRGIPWLALLLALGCAPARRKVTAGSKTTKPAVEAPAAFVDVQRDASGITLTQRVPLTDDVRADYETAVRMLEQEQYQRGIDLLLKVT